MKKRKKEINTSILPSKEIYGNLMKNLVGDIWGRTIVPEASPKIVKKSKILGTQDMKKPLTLSELTVSIL